MINRLVTGIIVAAVLSPGMVMAKAHKVNTHASHHSSKGKKAKKGSWRSHGQQAINQDRTREIQEALIREHYLDGEASGVMDQRTKAALVRLQGENGWQTKVIPDSRALIRLGLGPKHDGVLNPETAAISGTVSTPTPQ